MIRSRARHHAALARCLVATVTCALVCNRAAAAEHNDDTALGIAFDKRFDGVYACGTSSGSFLTDNAGDTDAWIARYSALGQRAWIQTIGSSGEDVAVGVAADAFGDVFVAGTTDGTVGEGAANAGNDDAWIAKFFVNGRRAWIRQFGSAGGDAAGDIAADTAGNAYVAGFTTAALGSSHFGEDDAWLAKYDAAGNQVWIRQIGTTTDDVADAVAVSPRGPIYVGGFTRGKLGRGGGGQQDIWIAAYTPGGRLLWVRQWGSPADDGLTDLAVDEQGNVAAVGYTYGSFGARKRNATADAWVALFSPAGQMLWNRQISSNRHEFPDAVAAANGQIFMGGVYESSTNLEDGWLAQFDLKGNATGLKFIATPASEEVNGIALGAKGEIYLAADSEQDNEDGVTDEDGVVTRMGPFGRVWWTKKIQSKEMPDVTNSAYIVHYVAPVAIDPRSNPTLKRHTAIHLPQPPRDNRLVVFLPGTGANVGLYGRMLAAFADEGYYVIGLNYPNNTTVDTFCGDSTDPDCAAKVRGEFLTGQDQSPNVVVPQDDAIEFLLYSFLDYLNTNFPAEGWNTWMDTANRRPVWSNIIVSGHSQGAGYAAFIAKSNLVARCVMIGGPVDVLPDESPAPWLTRSGLTPLSKFYAFGHIYDGFFPEYERNWIAMGIDQFGAPVDVDFQGYAFNGAHHVLTSIPPSDGKITGLKCHNSLGVDLSTPLAPGNLPVYGIENVWRYIIEVP